MFISDFGYIQDVQNVYAELTKLQCIITDNTGKPLTENDRNPNVFQLLCEDGNLSETFGQWANTFSKVNGPVLYDALPGVKIIICPIHIHANLKYFIFAGAFLECSSKKTVRDYLENELFNSEQTTNLLSQIEEIPHGEIHFKLEKITTMAKVLAEWLSTQLAKQRSQQKEQMTNDFLKLFDSEETPKISDLLEQFCNNHEEIQFVGYAKKCDDSFTIVEYFHPEDNESKLKGVHFSIGEGILGQAVAYQEIRFWKNISLDPRSRFFHENGLYPKAVCCFPIVQDQEITGLFFVGCNQLELFENDLRHGGKFISLVIKMIEKSNSLKNLVTTKIMKMTMANEIFQVMMSVRDIKRVQLILLDMSLNLIRSPFASVIIQDPIKKTLDIVSRGLTGEQIDDYVNDIRNRYFKDNESSIASPAFKTAEHVTSWGGRVFEVAISYHNELYGCLCIGLSDSHLKEEDITFLKSLAIAGGISVHLQKVGNQITTEQRTVDLLIDLQQHHNPEHYQLATKAKNLINGFNEYRPQGKLSINALANVPYFIIYDPKLLADKLRDEKIYGIISEYKQVENGTIPLANASLNVQVLTLVWRYLTENESVENISNIEGLNRNLVTDFLSYLARFNIIEKEIPLTKHNLLSFEPKINRSLNLSKREMEVVNLVLKGNNNREIAERLYISEHTVKNHMTNIFHKLNVNDRSQVIAKIYQTGFRPKDVSL